MKALEKFEAEIIAFAVGTVAVLVLVAAFAMGAFAQPQRSYCPNPHQVCVTSCRWVGYGTQRHEECVTTCHNECF